jgi:hypothetical protein
MSGKKENLPRILGEDASDVYNLLDMFEFFLAERQLGKPIDDLAEAVRDLRIIIQRLLLEYVMKLAPARADKFATTLAVVLARRADGIPAQSREDRKYAKYCIGEMITAFEWSVEIKKQFPRDAEAQRILALDIPVLRPFDYGLRTKIRLVKPPRRKRR